MKYCVEISEEQLRIISVAVDEYMRLRMGQFEPLTEDLVFDGEDKKQLYEKPYDIDTVEYKGEKARKVSIWTGGADEPYFMHQIGVFGRLNDDPEDTLLFLMQDDRGVEIPAIGTADHEFQIAVLLAVSTKANISLTVDPQVEAIMRMVREMVLKEISQHNDAPDAHAKIITEATSKALKELEESGQIMSEDRVKELIKESGGGGGGSSGGYYGKYDLTLSVDGWKAVSDSEGEMPYGLGANPCCTCKFALCHPPFAEAGRQQNSNHSLLSPFTEILADMYPACLHFGRKLHISGVFFDFR